MTRDQVWFKVVDFWQQNGILLLEQDPTTGVMRTAWVENRADIKSDFVTDAVRSVFDGLYSASTRDQFRVRVERGDKPGTTELFLTHFGMSQEIRAAEVSAAVPHVAAVPRVREWMKKTQRECVQFGNLVMEGRDIGTNVFPETDFKYYLDAHLEERARRREAEGVRENLAERDLRDSQRAAAPLMIALGQG